MSSPDEQFLYLTTIGRKSGQPRGIEIWFVEHAGRYFLVSEHRESANWVQNIQHNPAVTFSIGTRENNEMQHLLDAAQARIVDSDTEAALVEVVSNLMNAKYEWSDGLIVEIAPLAQ